MNLERAGGRGGRGARSQGTEEPGAGGRSCFWGEVQGLRWQHPEAHGTVGHYPRTLAPVAPSSPGLPLPEGTEGEDSALHACLPVRTRAREGGDLPWIPPIRIQVPWFFLPCFRTL